MQRYRLAQTVRVEGPNVWGVWSAMELKPMDGSSNWYWHIPGFTTVTITPELMRVGKRCVVLEYCNEGKDKLFDEYHRLHEFEHIGALRAAGLEGVMVTVYSAKGPCWPPYDGGSFQLWNAVAPYLEGDGELKPWEPSPDMMATYVLPEDRSRHVSYGRNGNKVLRLTTYLDYRGYDKHRYSFEYPTQDIRELMRARTLGWPPSRRWISKAAQILSPVLMLAGRQWPHHPRVVWPQEVTAHAMLQETAQHRMLDMLGVFAFVPPKGHYLCGSLHSCRGGHALDVPLARQLHAKANVVPFRKVA